MIPKVLILCCNWNGWSCFEDAANSGLHFPASVKIVRVDCLSRIHSGFILKAFDMKADGVMLTGCEPGSCHFGTEAACINREYEKTREIIKMLGIRQERLSLVQLPPFDGNRFVSEIEGFINKLNKISARRTRKTGQLITQTE